MLATVLQAAKSLGVVPAKLALGVGDLHAAGGAEEALGGCINSRGGRCEGGLWRWFFRYACCNGWGSRLLSDEGVWC